MNIPEVRRPTGEVLAKVHSLTAEKGKIAMIEPESGEWFLGGTLLDALQKARVAHPDRIFYSVRVGYPFAHEHKGGIQRI